MASSKQVSRRKSYLQREKDNGASSKFPVCCEESEREIKRTRQRGHHGLWLNSNHGLGIDSSEFRFDPIVFRLNDWQPIPGSTNSCVNEWMSRSRSSVSCCYFTWMKTIVVNRAGYVKREGLWNRKESPWKKKKNKVMAAVKRKARLRPERAAGPAQHLTLSVVV